MDIDRHKLRHVRGNQAGAITLVSGDSITVPSGATLTVAGTLVTTGTLTIGAGATLTSPVLVSPVVTDLSEVVTTTNVIGAGETGKTFYLNAVGGFTSTLPAPALGLRFKFIVKAAPTGASYVITTNGGANVLFGKVLERAGTAGVAGAAQDTFNFVVNQAIVSDYIEVESDGTNWYLHGMVDVAAGATFAVT